jgi:HEAT repeat protein
MPIALDCPRCGKHYEVEDSHAGKKSRCKQCGEVFKIPAQEVRPEQRDAVCEPISRPTKSKAAQDWTAILARSSGTPQPKPASAAEALVAVILPKIVLNCPQCLKRYEVDGALAGRKSRCKDCGEIFTIPTPVERPARKEPVMEPAPPAAVPSYWESALEVEPAQPAVSRPAPRPMLEDEVALPPRAPAPERSRRKSSRRTPIDSEFGITLAGFYVALAILVLLALSVWHGISEPDATKFGFMFRLALVGLLLVGYLLSFAGSIWLLVIAFREKLEQGLLVLLVPCYALYYTISRWSETRGTFAMQLSLALVVGSFLLAQTYMFHLAPASGDLANKMSWFDSAPQPGEEFAAAQGDEPVRPFGDHPVPPAAAGPPGFSPPPGFPGQPMAPGFGTSAPPPGFPTSRDGKPLPFDDWVKQTLDKQGDRAVAVVNLGLPVNDDPARGPTSHDVTDAIGKRLKELAPSASSSVSIGTSGKWATFFSPVDDVRALAKAIDYGTASVNGRQILVQVAREYIAAVPKSSREPAVASRPAPAHERPPDPAIPEGADSVTKSLVQLKSHDKEQRKEALRRLRRTTPNNRKEEVVDALLPLLDDDDVFLVDEVLQAMDNWQSPKAVPALIHRTKDDRVFVRRRAIKTLAEYKDPRSIEPIAERLQEDAFEAKDALIRMGSMVEPAMIDRLRHHESRIRSMACEVLMYVGGIETLKAMQSIPPDPDLGVQNDARRAIKQIVARVGPLPKDADSKKATATTTPKKRKQP